MSSLSRTGAAFAAALTALSCLVCKGDRPAPPAPVARAPTSATRAAPAPAPAEDAAAPPAPCAELSSRPSRHPAPARVVAIGDVHGDLEAARRALALAGAIDEHDRWIGADLVLVQTGDVLDRGDDERAILDLFARLAREAEAAGGAVLRLLGNHETMNARGDFRYVTPGGFAAFAEFEGRAPGADGAAALAALPARQRGRAAAFRPGGVYARRLAQYDTVIIVGDTAFAHGGVLPAWADYGVARLNTEIRCWLAGVADPPRALASPTNPLWSRDYSLPPERCEALERALTRLDVTRMVVAHTPQKGGISSACDDRVWRIDTGMSAHYGGPVEVLEIRGQDVRVLRPEPSK